MKLGFFYQSGYRIEACYYALEQLRKHYPDAPVALYEDNTDILKPVAKKFNCVYGKTNKQGFNDPDSGRPAFNLETILAWLDRVYEACTTTLKDTDWILHFEDDVWVKRPLQGEPPFDLSGIGGRGWAEELYLYLGASCRGAHGCGGSVFNRLKFIEAYYNVKDIDWKYIDELAVDPRPSEWTDSALTLVFLHSKYTVGSWNELQQYKNSKVSSMGLGRLTWPGTMKELEAEQENAAIIHCWKPYYYSTQEEKNHVLNNIININ
jgi:hypothetical protein